MATYYCVPCGVRNKPERAVMRVDGDPMCQFHADSEPIEAERTPLQQKASVGIDWAPARPVDGDGAEAEHTPRNAGEGRSISSQADTSSEANHDALPKEVGDVVVVPRCAVPRQRAQRCCAQELVVRLLKTKVDESIATRCGTGDLARMTVKNVRHQGKKIGLIVGSSIKDDIAYLWVQKTIGGK